MYTASKKATPPRLLRVFNPGLQLHKKTWFKQPPVNTYNAGPGEHHSLQRNSHVGRQVTVSQPQNICNQKE